MSEALTSAPELTADEILTLKDVAANYASAVSGEHVPGEIPTTDVRPPASVWPAGDVHHTHDQVWDESPAGVQQANAPDPRDLEIIRLNAIIAGTSKDPDYVPQMDPKDAEIARLKAQVASHEATAAPAEVQASEVDPRDAEIERLRAELTAASEPDPDPTLDPARPPASTAAAGDAATE